MIAALVAVVWSAIVFVWDIRRRREADRKKTLLMWQKTKVQELLHSAKFFMSVQDITEHLRSASFDASVQVEKHELSAAEVRVLLLEMLEAGQIAQLWGDIYGIEGRNPAQELALIKRDEQELAKGAFSSMSKAPGRLTTSQLQDLLGYDKLEPSTFSYHLHSLVALQLAHMSADGLWSPSTTSSALIEG